MNISRELENKKIAVLGMGREGWSTYGFLRNLLPEQELYLIDKREDAFLNKSYDRNTKVVFGENYLSGLSSYDLIFKAPGIPTFLLPVDTRTGSITSQTDLFLKIYSKQCIGVTGTKGKSTSSSLIYHILKSGGRKVHLAGNIGIPPLDIYDKIAPEDFIVMEMSSHQLENISISPHIGIILNLFEEHLDHYNSYYDYCAAKLNLGKFQNADDKLIYGYDNEMLRHLVAEILPNHKNLNPFSHKPVPNGIYSSGNSVFMNSGNGKHEFIADLASLTLPGDHNRGNAMAAASACYFCGMKPAEISDAIGTFKGLPHRIEFVGEYAGIHFYDDSISTIPAATIQAVETLKEVSTLILGGFDRGIDYQPLVEYLVTKPVQKIIFIGPAGKRINQELTKSGEYIGQIFVAEDFRQLTQLCFEHTEAGKICLLSPAAASYDMFKNFEERGDVFKKNVREYLTFL